MPVRAIADAHARCASYSRTRRSVCLNLGPTAPSSIDFAHSLPSAIEAKDTAKIESLTQRLLPLALAIAEAQQAIERAQAAAAARFSDLARKLAGHVGIPLPTGPLDLDLSSFYDPREVANGIYGATCQDRKRRRTKNPEDAPSIFLCC